VIPRKRILRIWQEIHGELSDEMQDTFLSREEIDFLSTQDELLITRIISDEKALKRIVELVKDETRPTSHFEHKTYLPIREETRPRHPFINCPDCNEALVLKTNSATDDTFWGCTNWSMNADKGFCRIAVATKKGKN